MSTNSSGSIRQALGRARAHATKHVDRWKKLLNDNPIPWDTTTTIEMIAKMEVMKDDIRKINDLWERWELLVDSIDEAEAHTLENDIYNEWRNKPEYDELMDDLQECVAKTKSASSLKYTAPPLDDTQHSDDDHVSTTSKKSNEDTSPTVTPIQLSSLNIPKFDGDYSKWNNFWELFDLFIHQGKYAAVSKLAALRSLLQGRALAEIEGFNTCAANYETVVKTLKDRFGNQQLVIRELELKLDNIPSARPNAASIGSTVTAVTNLCRQLKNLGIDIDNNSMKNNVIKKMPLKEQKQLQELLFDEPTTSIDTILDKMKKMEMKAELFASIDQSSTSNTSSSPMPSRKSFDISNNSWKNKNDPSKSFQQTFSCSFCNGNHKSVECRNYSTAEQRIQQLQRLKKCSNCMSKEHLSRNCTKSDLKCKYCQAPHYAFLCTKKQSGTTTKAMISINKDQSSMLSRKANIYTADRDLQPATFFFDSGSQRSYVTTVFASTMKLPKINKEQLNVQGFGGKISVYNSDLVKIRVQTVDGPKEIFANTTNKIADRLPVIHKSPDDAYTRSAETPDILIGMDYYCQFVTDSKPIKQGLYEVSSIVGKMYTGKVPFNTNTTISSLAVDPQMQNGPDECETFWKLESMGIVDHSIESEEDKAAQANFESTVRFKNNRYYISWPYKSDAKPLPSNAGLSIARLRSTWNKLQQNPDLIQQYQTGLEDQAKRGTTEIAPKTPQGKVVHYLPHHAVLTPQKTTTKVRIVFDGSAKTSKENPSLNDCLYRGPIDMPEIPGLLMKMRTAKILVTGDIEKAFHQIYLNEVDRDAVRFFWLKDLTKPPERDNLVAHRFVGIPFGVITSPSILSFIIKIHLKKQEDPKLRQLLKFVDNLFLLEEDSEEALRMFKLVRDCFLSASMNVREWLTNDPTVLNSIPGDIKQNSTTTKILGIEWNATDDTFSIALKETEQPLPWTKRKVLKFIASTYDPLGFLSPITIKSRIFMQQLFQEKLKWDDPLSKILIDEWLEILKSWKGSITVPRRLIQSKFPDPDKIEIHVFADASQYAYCAAVYLRIQTDEKCETRLIFAKTRLQPINKNLTIPKMEIMGIWLAAKIGSYVSKEMNLHNSPKTIWTDSQISFYWFKKWPKEIFVANRLKEVLEANAECLFVPGILNPADLGTRGIILNELQKDVRWLTGPAFLKEPREQWPKIPDLGNDITQSIVALVSINTTAESINFQTTVIDRKYQIDEDLSWDELKVQIACRLKGSDDIQPIDLTAAEHAIIIQEQEIFIKPNDIKQLKLVKDPNGIYRSHCRFDHAELINAEPILIPKKSSIAKMICLDAHKKLQHAGCPHTLAKLREQFWIPAGRAQVKKCIHKCVDCKYWKSKPFALPDMPQLPASRINRSKPFQNVGIDYCGPFKVKGKPEKAWIILFTCFSTRLIHLELVSTMTAEDFLLSFRKFVSRCGAPRYILSDNAKQFKTTANALNEIWEKSIKDEASIDYFLRQNITWDFITERSPWKGGLYERLVALVKNALKFSIGRNSININEFSAILSEIEAALNSRPLTYVHAKEPFVIRPADFIYPSINLNIPATASDNQHSDPSYMPSTAAGGEYLTEKYFKTLEYLDKFWNLWSKDYLNLLRERTNNEHKNARGALERHPNPGEYVLVSEADQPRGSWKIAKIVDCIESSDGEIRSTEIEYLNGFKTRRSINHLYPLEESAEIITVSHSDYSVFPFVTNHNEVNRM